MFNPLSKQWSLYCVQSSNQFSNSDADQLCSKLGHDRALNYSLVEVSQLLGDSTWALINQIIITTTSTTISNITHTSWCPSNYTISIACTTFDCTSDDPKAVNGLNDTALLVETPEEVPIPLYVISLNESKSSCIAYSIASKWLLTSGQCLKCVLSILIIIIIHFFLLLRNIQSVTQLKDIRITNQNRTWSVPVTQVRIHPKYSIFRSIRFPDYDMALLETVSVLNSSIINSSSICLPKAKIDPEITCFIGTNTGTGTVDTDIKSAAASTTPETAFEVLEITYCNSSDQFQGAMTARSICAARTGLTDSQQPAPCLPPHLPLLCLTSQSEWYLAGFITYQRGCPASSVDHPELPLFLGYYKHPTVFSNLFAMKDFIEQSLGFGTYHIDRPKITLLSQTLYNNSSNNNNNNRALYIRKDGENYRKTDLLNREQKSFNQSFSKLESNKNLTAMNYKNSTTKILKDSPDTSDVVDDVVLYSNVNNDTKNNISSKSVSLLQIKPTNQSTNNLTTINHIKDGKFTNINLKNITTPSSINNAAFVAVSMNEEIIEKKDFVGEKSDESDIVVRTLEEKKQEMEMIKSNSDFTTSTPTAIIPVVNWNKITSTTTITAITES